MEEEQDLRFAFSNLPRVVTVPDELVSRLIGIKNQFWLSAETLANEWESDINSRVLDEESVEKLAQRLAEAAMFEKSKAKRNPGIMNKHTIGKGISYLKGGGKREIERKEAMRKEAMRKMEIVDVEKKYENIDFSIPTSTRADIHPVLLNTHNIQMSKVERSIVHNITWRTLKYEINIFEKGELNAIRCGLCSNIIEDSTFSKYRCGHQFHNTCSDEWIMEHTECPHTTCKNPQLFRYMKESTDSTKKSIAKRVNEIGPYLLEKNNLGNQRDFKIPNPGIITALGVVHFPFADQTMRIRTMHLLNTSFEEKTKLDVEDISNIYDSIFPGQIIAARGRATGERLVVSELYSDATISRDSKTRMQSKIFVASGPFTDQTNIQYQQLNQIITYVKENKPDIVILIGPFVDAENEIIQSCNLEQTFLELFEEKVLRKLKSLSCEVVLVPSLRDVIHDCVFPQPPLNVQASNIRCVPNPCVVNINGTDIGITSVDVVEELMHSKEWSTRINEEDKIGHIYRNILGQRSFYPLFDGEQVVSMEHYDELSFQENLDVLIIPSSQGQNTVQETYSTLCLNPHSTTPSFSTLHIHSTKTNSVKKSCRIDIHTF